ncbi:MAG: hypothetical protein APG08_00392 [Candidatus Methanofastidiosum methylothiophilum]|uniref:Uncharacterized protein n=1 Tax=Candidatus Methanofastidiosum methylothiophilum TaxID=1705564 RepID=A0A150JDG8_9EURY|nr:MAG: hypothetical protein AN188_00244 [Candidatus Methanofastidiosum methylthiophilus]KYC57111.1 MAG: hypothetical protein APG08_00392 [Candidatus Methanofastidiosum methylthiophilus]OQC52529.1 MAG: hypothetical protein BWX56_00246 [Euryarchaeota archaeon ADurb.Bin023]
MVKRYPLYFRVSKVKYPIHDVDYLTLLEREDHEDENILCGELIAKGKKYALELMNTRDESLKDVHKIAEILLVSDNSEDIIKEAVILAESDITWEKNNKPDGWPKFENPLRCVNEHDPDQIKTTKEYIANYFNNSARGENKLKKAELA